MPIRDSVKHSCTQDALSILQRPLDEPLTPAMEAIGSHILKSKLKQSGDGATASFKTGGQVGNLHCFLPYLQIYAYGFSTTTTPNPMTIQKILR